MGSSVIIAGITFVVSAIFKLIVLKMQANREQEEARLKALNAQAKVTNQAREAGDKGFKITRRIIALTFVFAVVLAPTIPYVLMSFSAVTGIVTPAIEVHFGYNQLVNGFWPFTKDSTEVIWETRQGFMITPWHSDMVAMIMAMYFGDKITK